MPPFRYERATSLEQATARLTDAGALPLSGGTDLLVSIEEGLYAPEALVDLRAIPGARGIQGTGDGGLRIGGATRIDEIAQHPEVRAHFPALAEACEAVGTPALRRMGTLGGNLCQRPRCWYLRRDIPCLKNGGDRCPAHDGENQYLAILDGGPCWIVHPSDPAVALTALGAHVEIAGAAGTRTVPIEEFYVLPSERLDGETVLAHGEVVSAVIVAGDAADGTQLYRKLMQRGAWDFALASIAAVRRGDDEVRLVLGGVAPRPWRVGSSIEEEVSGGGLDEDTVETLAARALYDAEPLSKNGYKVELAASLLRDAIRALTA